MNSDEALHRIEQTIERESAQISDSFAFDTANHVDSRLACLGLVRSLNYGWLHSTLTGRDQDCVTFLTMARGFNGAMSLFMGNGLDKEGVPNAPSSPELEKWSDSILLRLGLLRLAQRVIDLTRAELVEFVDGSADRLCF